MPSSAATENPAQDAIRPDHYSRFKHEPIKVIEAWGIGPEFHLGSVLKYLARAPHKGDAVTDLQKAMTYLEFAIDSFRPIPIRANQAEVDFVVQDWELSPLLRDTVHHLVKGNWVAAHLLIATELERVKSLAFLKSAE